MERYLSIDEVDETFSAWWTKFGSRPETMPLALQETRKQIGGRMPPDYEPPPQRSVNCCMVNRGEFADEYLVLNGLSMEDLLKKLKDGGRDHLLELRAHVAEASGVFNGRLMTAMDAVWYRHFDPALRAMGEELVQADLDTFLLLEPDQRSVVNAYMRSDARAARVRRRVPVASGGGGTPFPDSVLVPLDTEEKTEFKRRVYNAHVTFAISRGRTFRANLPEASLAVIENGQRMLKDAVAPCQQLLAKARADLAAAQEANDALAMDTMSIGPGSGYRAATEELTIWEGLFPRYYERTLKARQAADGGEHGDKAVGILLDLYKALKAAPGFGNHTNGIALDFVAVVTAQLGKRERLNLGAEFSQTKEWFASWFHRWLVAHAADFDFKPIATEAWHWEYLP